MFTFCQDVRIDRVPRPGTQVNLPLNIRCHRRVKKPHGSIFGGTFNRDAGGSVPRIGILLASINTCLWFAFRSYPGWENVAMDAINL